MEYIVNEKIRVLQSVGSLGIGGTEIFVMNFYRHFDKDEFQVDFVIYDDSRLDFYEEVKKSGSQVYICSSHLKNKWMKLISEMWQVRKVLKKNHYDVIHCHGNSFRELFRGAIPGKLTRKTKVITHSHNDGEGNNTLLDNFCRSLLKRCVCCLADLGCTCSDIAGKAKYTDSFMKTSKYVLINNAIETEKYAYNPAVREKVRRKLNIKDNEYVIGYVGRISYQKNPIFLIDLFYEFSKMNDDAKLLLVGDGELRAEVEGRVKKYHLDSKVIFVGKCISAAEYYHAMDCFVLPSIFEGFGLVNIEAQVSGLPCIVSEAVPREIDISGNVSFLPLNLQKWEQSLQLLRNNKSKKRETVFTEKYNIIRECEHMQFIYEKVISYGK